VSHDVVVGYVLEAVPNAEAEAEIAKGFGVSAVDALCETDERIEEKQPAVEIPKSDGWSTEAVSCDPRAAAAAGSNDHPSPVAGGANGEDCELNGTDENDESVLDHAAAEDSVEDCELKGTEENDEPVLDHAAAEDSVEDCELKGTDENDESVLDHAAAEENDTFVAAADAETVDASDDGTLTENSPEVGADTKLNGEDPLAPKPPNSGGT